MGSTNPNYWSSYFHSTSNCFELCKMLIGKQKLCRRSSAFSLPNRLEKGMAKICKVPGSDIDQHERNTLK